MAKPKTTCTSPQKHWTVAAQMSDKSDSEMKRKFEFSQNRTDIQLNIHTSNIHARADLADEYAILCKSLPVESVGNPGSGTEKNFFAWDDLRQNIYGNNKQIFLSQSREFTNQCRYEISRRWNRKKKRIRRRRVRSRREIQV